MIESTRQAQERFGGSGSSPVIPSPFPSSSSFSSSSGSLVTDNGDSAFVGDNTGTEGFVGDSGTRMGDDMNGVEREEMGRERDRERDSNSGE